jgi:hypothetical protein
MNSIHIETTIETDGVLHVSNLPCQKGDHVEAIILVQPQADESVRQAARQRFLARADQSKFRSSGPYPSREKLHERA